MDHANLTTIAGQLRRVAFIFVLGVFIKNSSLHDAVVGAEQRGQELLEDALPVAASTTEKIQFS